MPFNSVEYFVFLWAAVLAFYAAPEAYRRPFLLVFCYAFYSFWSPFFALFLLAATAAAYWGARRLYSATALAFLLGAFVFFKGLPLWRQPFGFLSHVAVPVGFSYYTFRLLSYVIDVRRGTIEPEKDFVRFACYAAFFPHLLSGPIQRAEEFFPQTQHLGCENPELWASGLRLILCGLFKKLVIADTLAPAVDNVFGHPAAYNATALWVAAYAFYLQLYCDFSGLTDIAIGSGRLFGIDAPPNFNAPYLAKNIQDFWRRWHMTLCRWISDYLFTPLLVKLRNWGNAGLVFSLFVSMLAISLWHGLSSGFIAFGLIQGTLISFSVWSLKARNRFFKKREYLGGFRNFAGPLVTFHLLVFSFVFFKCATFREGMRFIARLFQGPFQFGGLGMGIGEIGLAACLLGLIAAEWFERAAEGPAAFTRRPAALRWSVYYAGVAGILLFGHFWPKEFIYFKF